MARLFSNKVTQTIEAGIHVFAVYSGHGFGFEFAPPPVAFVLPAASFLPSPSFLPSLLSSESSCLSPEPATSLLPLVSPSPVLEPCDS